MPEGEGRISAEDAVRKIGIKQKPGDKMTYVHGIPVLIKPETEIPEDQARSVLKQSENTKEAKKVVKRRAKEIRSLLKRLNDQNDQGRIQRDALLSELQSLG